MKKTMFKRIFAGIAAVFTLGLCVPTGFTNIITQPSFEAVAEDEWLDTHGIEYKTKDRDTLIINDNSDAPIVLSGYNFKTYAADIKHLQIGKGWRINNFSYLTAIESLTIGDNCTIGASAFLESTALTSVEIGDNCNIGANAFYGCSALTSVKIGDNCNIGTNAFYGCAALTSVAFGDSCTVNTYAFYSCTSLTNVAFGDSCTVNTYAFYSCTSLTNVTFRDSCTIRKGAFVDCNSIEKVTFYGGLTENVKVDAINPDIIRNKSRWTICDHDFDANHKCKITECGYECTHDKFNTDHQCTICGYFDEAATQAEIDANEAEIEQKENEIKQKENEITQKQERNAYLKSLLNEQETQSENESDNNTASTFSEGSILAIIGGSTFLILCGLAAVIIVKRRKKTQ